MKNTKKRGFTIVELVIVIAVIAILAAVLVPTFTNVVTKAKESAAMQNARSAWTAYLVDLADTGNVLRDKNVNGCIKVVSGDGEGAKTYYFEIKAGTFTGKKCTNESAAHKIYTISDGKIAGPTETKHTAPAAVENPNP